VRDRLSDFPARTSVAVLTFDEPVHVAQYVKHHDLEIPVLVDPTRDTYRAYGLERGSVLRVWGWRAAKRYAEILWKQKRGSDLGALQSDTLQLGGDFIVDASGNLAYGFWSEGPDDRPSIQELIDTLG
jgi:hypothetical protein